MLSFSNILIPGSRAAFHVTNNSDGPTTCTYSFREEGECRHYSLTKRGPILHEHQKGKCGNPVSVFVGLSRPPVIDPTNIVSFFETFGNLTPIYSGYYDSNALWAVSRRLLCLLEIIENFRAISQKNVSETTVLNQFLNCISLLAFSSPFFPSKADRFANTSVKYLSDEETNEVIITAPNVPHFMQYLLGVNFDEMHTSTPSCFDLTQERIKIIDGKLQNLTTANGNDREYYLQTDWPLPSDYELELFNLIKQCSQSIRFCENNGCIAVEAGDRFFSTAEIKSLERLSTLVIDRELNYFVQPIQYRYSFDKQEAVPEISCVHQLMYFSLLSLEPDAVYVDCSREKCRNKTVKLFGDKIIPCCCTSCRTAAASKRNRDKNKPGKTVLSEKR